MARVYLSFLGTNDYVECYYFRDSFETNRAARFVQEATILDNCKEWGPADRVIIFTTRDAEEKNWEDDGHWDHTGRQKLQRKGLRTCLNELDLPVSISREPIPDGHSEDEIWEIFEKVSRCLREGDEVVFDITHAFRSIPLVAMVVLNYVKVLRQVKLNGIHYGAFEALGSIREVKAMPVEQRRVRILNLTALDQLMDWTIATDRFLSAGDARMAGRLAQRGVAGILRESAGKDEAGQIIRSLGSNLEFFARVLHTCRGREITSVADRLKENLSKSKELDLPRPFRPVFELIENRLNSFSSHRVMDGLAAALWCSGHDLVQQGFTILEETILSHIVLGVSGDLEDKTQREIASQAFAIIAKKIVECPSAWHEPAAKYTESTRRMIAMILKHERLAPLMEKVKARRDDLNHAGFTDNALSVRRSESFGRELRELVIEAQIQLR